MEVELVRICSGAAFCAESGGECTLFMGVPLYIYKYY